MFPYKAPMNKDFFVCGPVNFVEHRSEAPSNSFAGFNRQKSNVFSLNETENNLGNMRADLFPF